MEQLTILIPEFILLAGALLVLFADRLFGGDKGGAWVGMVASAAAAGAVYLVPTSGSLFGGSLGYSVTESAVRAVIAGLTAIFALWVAGRGMGAGYEGVRSAEAISLAMISALGGMLLTGASDLVVLFLSIEITTMPAYVLMGYDTRDRRGMEGALKYFIMSMMTSLLMAYGLSFVFGLAGSTAYADIAQSPHGGMLALVASALVIVGFFAKLSAAPFHFWAPDAYEGAPAASVAFVSSVAKIGALVALVKMLLVLPGNVGLPNVLLVAAVISMVLGNFAAYPQSDVRRIIAYSGVAHAGYLLLGLGSGTTTGLIAAIFYVIAYAVPSLGLMLVVAEDGGRLADVSGLVNRRPYAAWASVVFLLSLVGIPPMAGFIGKLFLFAAALDGAGVYIVVFAVLMSAVSAGYYFKIIRAMFFGITDGGEDEAASVSPVAPETVVPRISVPAAAAVLACAALTLAIGVAASPLLNALQAQLP